MNYRESLDYLARLGDELRGMKFDLEIVRTLFGGLDHPERQYPTVVVAGTNGKGSTSAMLASILQCAGYRTGLYTSPHLVRVNERIRVNGCEISDQDFGDCLSEVERVAQRLLAEGVLPHLPSYFEFLTATGLLHFARSLIDFAVLEVGMGGRLDATNVTEPQVSIITNVELDHMQFLGPTHELIAYEKAGIIKAHRPVVSSCENPRAAEVIRRRAAELEADLIETGKVARVSNVRSDCGRYTFDLQLDGDCFAGLAPALRGRFQMKNAVTAVTAAWRLMREGFNISHRNIQEGLRDVSWPGRLEQIEQQPLVLLDGAHNPAAAQELAEFLGEHFSHHTLRLIYASMRDKAIGEICEILFPLAAEVYLTQLAQARAATPEEMLAATRYKPARVTIEMKPGRALDRARQASSPQDLILATGSLFLVGELKAVSSGNN
jgi:dihydrofolate synthase / folylpolyglutamate synthase